MNQYTTMSKASIEYLCKCINLTASIPELLNDVLPSQQNVYSSYRVTELLNTLQEDMQNYVNSALGNLSHLKKEIVSVAPTTDTAEEDTIYLVQDANGGYEQYLLINGVVTSLGSTSAMANVYTKSESDSKFALQSTLKSLVDAVGGLNDLSTTDKTSIVNAINELKTGLDTALNKSVIVTLTKAEYEGLATKDPETYYVISDDEDSVTISNTINSASTNDEIPTNKVVWDNCIQGRSITDDVISTYGNEMVKYPLGKWYITSFKQAQKISDIPLIDGVKNAGFLEIFSISPKVSPFTDAWGNILCQYTFYTGETFTRRIGSGSEAGVITSDSGWQRVCTTSVTDVTQTDFSSEESTITGTMTYTVKDGICYVVLWGVSGTKTGFDFVTYSSMPKCHMTVGIPFCSASSDGGNIAFAYINTNQTVLKINIFKTGIQFFGSFSYPVAES